MRRSPGALAGLALLLVLAGSAYLWIEVLQRHRFNARVSDVDAIMADLETRVRFQADSRGDIQVAQSGKEGSAPRISRFVNDSMKGRMVSWVIVIPMADPLVPSASAPGSLFSLFLVQERGWILHSPRLVVDRSRVCGTSAASVFDGMLEEHHLKSMIVHAR